MTSQRHPPFSFADEGREYTKSFQQLLAKIHSANVRNVLNPRNVEHLYHGVNWRAHSGDESAKEITTLEQHSVEHSVLFKDVVQHNLELIPETLRTLSEALHSQLMRSLFSKVKESTDKSGNVVSVSQEGSAQAAFLAMLEKIELGVDENGQISMPQIHVGPGNPLLSQLQNAGPEFEAKVDALVQEKSAAAQRREHERLSKFKS